MREQLPGHAKGSENITGCHLLFFYEIVHWNIITSSAPMQITSLSLHDENMISSGYMSFCLSHIIFHPL